MAVTLELYELKNLCRDMAELGAANYAKRMAPAKDKISQRDAFGEFGEVNVRRWLRAGVVSTTRSGASRNSKVLYSRAELIAADKMDKINIKL